MGPVFWPVFYGAIICAMIPMTAVAKDNAAGPLSVIDWLDKPMPAAKLPRAPTLRSAKPKPIKEPAVTSNGTAPQITTQSLEASAPRAVGLVPTSITGMQPDLWTGSDVTEVAHQIATLHELELPAANALLYTLLLAEADAPDGGMPALNKLTHARIEKLIVLGAVDPALALSEQAGAITSPALFDQWASLSLLVGTEDTACGILSRGSYLSQDIGLRVFCAARSGDWDTAALTFGSAQALSLLPRPKLDVLDRFLNPDLFEDAPPLSVPRQMDPLTFRLFETIGEPLSTGPLPRAYAVADLRDLAGWKSQLEAAERLTRAGALPDNRLLGLYTDRKPAASGGIWDRVRAIQRFDTALNTGSADAISKTLPDIWRQMGDNGLEVTFSTAFYDPLSEIVLNGAAARIQAQMGLLSPQYETAAASMPVELSLGDNTALLRAVAQGDLDIATFGTPPDTALPRAIFDAFTAPRARSEWVEMAKSQRLGEALLATLAALHDGARGDSLGLRDALGTLRALGLEDTARRAALQILLLDRDT